MASTAASCYEDLTLKSVRQRTHPGMAAASVNAAVKGSGRATINGNEGWSARRASVQIKPVSAMTLNMNEYDAQHEVSALTACELPEAVFRPCRQPTCS
jgi:hypothetical protein